MGAIMPQVVHPVNLPCLMWPGVPSPKKARDVIAPSCHSEKSRWHQDNLAGVKVALTG